MNLVRYPYLIQRGSINRPIGKFRKERLSAAVSLDYMGSSEFEFGALPKSFRAMESMPERAKLTVTAKFSRGESPLRVFHFFETPEHFNEYENYLYEIWTGKRRCKESPYFEPASGLSKRQLEMDFWWDIENHVMFSFNKPFMNHIHEYVAASLNYMNSKNKQNA